MMKMNWRIALLLITFALSGCQKSHSEAEVSGEAQGTTYHIKLDLDGTLTSVEEVRRQVSTTLAEIDAQLSNYREDSEISRINRQERTLGYWYLKRSPNCWPSPRRFMNARTAVMI
ncbi:MAG: FAD:protein FMN transferase [Methylobacter sp.]